MLLCEVILVWSLQWHIQNRTCVMTRRWKSHVKLPQQVALTALQVQVNAIVRVPIATHTQKSLIRPTLDSITYHLLHQDSLPLEPFSEVMSRAGGCPFNMIRNSTATPTFAYMLASVLICSQRLRYFRLGSVLASSQVDVQPMTWAPQVESLLSPSQFDLNETNLSGQGH